MTLLYDKTPYTFDRVIRLVFAAGLLGALIWLLGYLSDVLIPFVAALLLAYLVNPLVCRMQRFLPNRVAAVLASLTLVLIVLLLTASLLWPLVAGELRHMGEVLTDVANNSDISARAQQLLPADLWAIIQEYVARENVRQFFKADNLWALAEGGMGKIFPGVMGMLSGTFSFLLGLLGLAIILLYLVFLLIDYEKVRGQWAEFLPLHWRASAIRFVGEFERGMNRYFRAQALVAGITGIVFALGFSLIGLPMGILLGLLIGLLNMVPYLQSLGVIPAVLLGLFHALETGGSFWALLGLIALVFIVAQVFQDGVLVPKIMGDVTGLSPVMILLSLSIWGKLLGLFGLVVALPMTCLLLAYYRVWVLGEQKTAPAEDR